MTYMQFPQTPSSKIESQLMKQYETIKKDIVTVFGIPSDILGKR